MSVRKRAWKTSTGENREAWIANYTDGSGKRRLKTFRRKKDCDAFIATVRVQVLEGTHVADSASVTVAKAGELWLRTCDEAGLERSTLEQYAGHVRLHINPFIGTVKLSQLNVPTVRAFEDRLRSEGRSAILSKLVVRSLGALLGDAMERGLVAQNCVRAMRARRRKGKERQAERRQKGKLQVGRDIPTPQEIAAIIAAARGRWRPFLLVAIFCGLRASELRGLRWQDVDLARDELHVRQRADRFGAIGRPKSEAGERTFPFGPLVANALREWRLACPKGSLGLVFPNGRGNIENIANILRRGFRPTLVAAGVINPDGSAKYNGLHSLRHFCASWMINRRADGGLEMPLKTAQERLGHSTISMTADRYGHLFPRVDDGQELAAAERTLFAT